MTKERLINATKYYEEKYLLRLWVYHYNARVSFFNQECFVYILKQKQRPEIVALQWVEMVDLWKGLSRPVGLQILFFSLQSTIFEIRTKVIVRTGNHAIASAFNHPRFQYCWLETWSVKSIFWLVEYNYRVQLLQRAYQPIRFEK